MGFVSVKVGLPGKERLAGLEKAWMTTEQQSQRHCWLHSRTGLVLVVFLAVAAFFLLTEHRAHLFGILPYLLLLLCPLLHG